MLELIKKFRKSRGNGQYYYFGTYKCKCGSEFDALVSNVAKGNTTQCKSCAIESRRLKRRKHGHSYHAIGKTDLEAKCYYTWQAMKRRCYNENDKSYPDYGGRGIKVCKSWVDSYEIFLSDIGLPPTMNHSIERIDFNGDYYKENCKWIPFSDQASNKRNNRYILAFGKSLTIAEWSRLTGLDGRTITRRLDYGWNPEMALQSHNSKSLNKYSTPDGEFRSLPKLAEHYGMSVSGVHSRIKSNAYPEWKAINDRTKH